MKIALKITIPPQVEASSNATTPSGVKETRPRRQTRRSKVLVMAEGHERVKYGNFGNGVLEGVAKSLKVLLYCHSKYIETNSSFILNASYSDSLSLSTLRGCDELHALTHKSVTVVAPLSEVIPPRGM